MPDTAGAPIDLAAGDDLRVRIMPARGLDLAETWFDGELISWVDPAGVNYEPVAPVGRDDPFLVSFGGGLMLTCGLHNIGYTSGGQPWNGRFSLTAATDVSTEEGADDRTVSGEVFDAGLLSRRTIVASRRENSLTLTDVVSNESVFETMAPIMYHINLGGALVGKNTEVVADVTETEAVHGNEGLALVAQEWQLPFAALDGRVGLVTHRVASPKLVVSNPDSGLTLTLSWTGLDRLHFFVDHERMLLGIEPANAGQYGRETERNAPGVASLAPGESRTTSFTVLVERA